VRTLFNLLGPLANPAGVRRQVVGVFDRRWVVPMAEALLALGAERAWVVHGAGGLDELALEGESVVAEVVGNRVRQLTVGPAAAGVQPAPASALAVASVPEAADRLRRILAGERGPARDVVCLNAAAALVVAEKAPDLRAGVALAARALDDGAAAGVLDRVVRFTTDAGADR
jgi:anthranilate phosphoribosyltransferase